MRIHKFLFILSLLCEFCFFTVVFVVIAVVAVVDVLATGDLETSWWTPNTIDRHLSRPPCERVTTLPTGPWCSHSLAYTELHSPLPYYSHPSPFTLTTVRPLQQALQLPTNGATFANPLNNLQNSSFCTAPSSRKIYAIHPQTQSGIYKYCSDTGAYSVILVDQQRRAHPEAAVHHGRAIKSTSGVDIVEEPYTGGTVICNHIWDHKLGERP